MATNWNRAALWAPVILWMAVIFVASSRTLPKVAMRVPDTLTHGFAFGVLAALIYRARQKTGMRAVAIAVIGAILYGVTDEFHQSFVPGRDPDVGDIIKDAAGALVAAFVCEHWRRRTLSASQEMS